MCTLLSSAEKERFIQRTGFVCDAHENGCAGDGNLRECQGPHVAANDILRLLFDVKIAPRILAGNFWMTKSVQRMFVVLICVPIVEIKVVQQRTDEQCMRIGADVQAAIEPAAICTLGEVDRDSGNRNFK